jgi:ATP-dependent Clp protease ATP-binding subunit ClpC
MGARPLRRAVQKFIEDPLSEQMLMGTFKAGDHILADVENDGIVFRKIDKPQAESEDKELVNS